ncbi:MAG TPA: hypothetical protein VMT24_13395 [Aggregatilineaceae bacterium]|nr:hypothetical protein [Aggregatilineaceae bacterium]
MTGSIEPFYRISSRSVALRRAPRVLRVMRIHFALFGTLLLLAAFGLFSYLYWLDFQRVHLGLSLKIERAGDIYRQKVQFQFAAAVALGVASLVPFRAVNLLSQGRRSGLAWARVAAIMLLVGSPLGFWLWNMVSSSSTVSSAAPGFLRQVLRAATWVIGAAAVLQAILAVWYIIATYWEGLREVCANERPMRYAALRHIRRFSIGVWVILMIALGLTLGVLTDWVYEVPVSTPAPGQFLYATTFDAFNDEWDIYPGRDSAEIAGSETLSLTSIDIPVAALSGNALAITYGSGMADELVWSTLSRKFNDIDLRVTTRQISGPTDQSQYGVIFRYRNATNFYIFRISSDGYYLLAKVKDGVQEKISDWGVSEAIHQGQAANEIRIVARGDEFRFYVNGQPMPLCLKGTNETSMWASWEGPGICYTDKLTYVYTDNSFKQGRVALAAGTIDGSAVAVAFDDLLMVGPIPEAMTVPVDK